MTASSFKLYFQVCAIAPSFMNNFDLTNLEFVLQQEEVEYQLSQRCINSHQLSVFPPACLVREKGRRGLRAHLTIGQVLSGVVEKAGHVVISALML